MGRKRSTNTNNPKKPRARTPAHLQQPPADVLEDAKSLVEWICDRGEIVFDHDWDSGGMAGRGSESVFKRGGRYAFSSIDFGRSGPYSSLGEAIKEHDLLCVTDATDGISCSELTTDEIVSQLTAACEVGHTFTVNGGAWRCAGKDGFVRLADAD